MANAANASGKGQTLESLSQLVRRAQRRLTLRQLCAALPWRLGIALALTAVALISGRLMDWRLNEPVWIVGGAALGALATIAWGARHRPTPVAAALEVDRSCALDERLSSAVALGSAERETPAGRALIRDAARRAERIDVRACLSIAPGRRVAWPLAAAAVALGVALLVPPATQTTPAAVVQQQQAERKQVQNAAEALRKRLAERREQAKKDGAKLEDGNQLFDRVEKGVRELERSEQTDRKQALLKLNDLARDLEQRRRELGPEALKDQLKRLAASEGGPADKLARAMQRGDVDDAARQAQELRKQLQDQKLDAEAQRKLGEQLQQLEQKVQEAAQARKETQERLEREAAAARAAGSDAKANALEEQLAKMAQSAAQDGAMKKLSEQLGEAARQMAGDDPEAASKALDSLEQTLDELAQQIQESEALNNALEAIADARSSMGCKQCGGDGCEACQGGQGNGGNQAGGQQAGLGQPGQRGLNNQQGGNQAGRGRGGPGLPSEEGIDPNFYETRVGQKAGRGGAVITGTADGPNLPGQVRQEIQAQAEAVRQGDVEALTDQPLSRAQRDHARQYFDNLREGK